MARQLSDETISVGEKCRAAKVDLPAPDEPINKTSDGSGISIVSKPENSAGLNGLVIFLVSFRSRRAGGSRALGIRFRSLLFDIASLRAGRIEARVTDAFVINV